MASISLALPRRQPGLERDVLAEFIRSSQPWSAERVPVPTHLRRLLLILIPVDLVWGVLLAALAVAPGGCATDGICQVVTLGQRAPILLGCAALSLVGLSLLAIPTRGLAYAYAREVAGLTVAAVAGGAALIGIIALLVAVLAGLIVVAAFWAVFTHQIELAP